MNFSSRRALLPVTLSLELGILLLAWKLDAFRPGVGERLVERWGFGWPSLREGRWVTLWTSTALVESVSQWLRIAFLVAWSVGACEWCLGSLHTLWVFAVTSTVAPLVLAIVCGAAQHYDFAALGALAELRDVGASAGAFGCAGALVAAIPERWRRRSLLALWVYLVAKPLLLPSLTADLTHGIAVLLGSFLVRGRRPGERPTQGRWEFRKASTRRANSSGA